MNDGQTLPSRILRDRRGRGEISSTSQQRIVRLMGLWSAGYRRGRVALVLAFMGFEVWETSRG